MISAAAGIGATLLGTQSIGGKGRTEAATQHWMSILNVDLNRSGGPVKGVRVIAEVNGRGISYPTRALWAEPSPEMSPEAFPVEQSGQYRIRLEVLALDDEGQVNRFISQDVDVITAQQIPIENVYEVHSVGSDMVRSGPVLGRVRYSLSDRPG